MEIPKFTKENLAFNNSAIKMGFDALNTITEQTAVASDLLLSATPAVPEEGKKAVGIFFKEGQKVLDRLKTNMEKSLDLDWTAKNAPVKNLEVMETFCKDSFSHVEEIKKETKTLFDKATKSLPKEAKALVETWNESVNNGYEFFQSFVFKNFEFTKRAMTDAPFITPMAGPRAAK
jgi:hypothetical protein